MTGVVTGRAAFERAARTAPDHARVPVEVRVDVADPFGAYRRARDGPGGVLLETTGGQEGWGYFAVDPVSRVQVGPDAVSLDTNGGGDDGAAPGPFDPPRSPTLETLRSVLDGETLVRGDCDVPYPCGAFGWLSYDVVRELEELPDTTVDDRGLPRMQLAVFDRVAAWREPRGERTSLRVTACPRLDEHADATAAYEYGRARAMDLVERIERGDHPGVGPPPVRAERSTFESECGRAAFRRRVRRIKRHVRDGDTFQANVSQRLVAPAAVHPVDAYAALRRVNPAPYSSLLEFPGVDLVSASPELLLDVEPDGNGTRLLTEPIAGTRPRGDTAEADRALERDLTDDEKERAEHAMLIDLERNDLGKVSDFGTVDVREYRRVDRYAEVMHLVSLVEGRLREGYDVAGALAATFPGGTVTGAPKPKTMTLIDEVEATRRGPYTGSVGVFGFDGRATCNIVIRTLVRTDDQYALRVGAGVVHDSEPDAEYDETLAKGRALVTAVDEALADADLTIEEVSAE
ncbi:anthranilate synthase component I [Halobacteriales archaeon QS_4_70_19]|nr:MAG: anthranilate synthase component I [Halobacteriales archaeon QS_4_70_19]